MQFEQEDNNAETLDQLELPPCCCCILPQSSLVIVSLRVFLAIRTRCKPYQCLNLILGILSARMCRSIAIE